MLIYIPNSALISIPNSAIKCFYSIYCILYFYTKNIKGVSQISTGDTLVMNNGWVKIAKTTHFLKTSSMTVCQGHDRLGNCLHLQQTFDYVS